MSRKKAPKGRGHGVDLSAPGIEIHPPRTIVCNVCGVKGDIGEGGLPIESWPRCQEFNRRVEAFVEAHRPCFSKEVK